MKYSKLDAKDHAREHMRGIWAAALNPMTPDFKVDEAGLRANIDHWIEQIEVIDTLDFEVLSPGHGNVGDKASVAEAVEYMETLRGEVLTGLKAGKSVEELQESVTLEQYADWSSYDDWRTLNIEGAAASLQASGAVE